MIWNCNDFREDLIENKQKKIQGELSLKLEELTGLSKHDKVDDAWDDLKKVVASVISIQKINSYRDLIGRYGVDWYKEYYDGTTKDEVNPVKLIAEVWSNSDEIGFDCEGKNGEWGEYFKECNQEAKFSGSGNAKVVRVLKSTYDKNRKYYIPERDGWGGWANQKEVLKGLMTKYRNNISKTGKLGDVIIENCSHLGGLFNWGENTFCQKIMEKFFGANVKDKRYCLYEMPETEEDFTSTEFFKKRKND